MSKGFGEHLVEAGQRHGRLCVGIDPHRALLQAWGLDVSVEGLQTFTMRCVEAFAGNVALVKPQVAFFEAFGSKGYAILERAIADLRDAGTLVLADAKRGDIGSTMAGYAQAWLEPGSPLESDAVTVSPYLGFGSLQPAVELALESGKGLFVLAATSNPEARELQDQCDRNGVSISQQMVDAAAALNAKASGVGSIGVVVGATLANPPRLASLNGPVLLPGVGAQGAGPEDVARITQGVEDFSFANVSREVLRAGPDPRAITAKAQEMAGQMR